MNVGRVVLWGFVATLVLTTLLSGARGARATRMSLPLMIGTMFSADWDRAQRVGIIVHLLLGWVLALPYALIFHDVGMATWWIGAILGVVHGMALLVVGMVALPHFHPRMSHEIQEPIDLPLLEPPGFMGLNYGPSTPVVTLLAHAIYGAILGGFY